MNSARVPRWVVAGVVILGLGAVGFTRAAIHRSSPTDNAFASCDAYVHSGVGNPNVAVKQRRTNLQEAADRANRAADGDGSWAGLASSMRTIDAAYQRHGYAPVSLKQVVDPTTIALVLQACQAADPNP